jgi:hypothetical protein
MATYKPELHSLDSVLSYYDQYDEPGYSVYAGHKPETAYCRFTYLGNDKNIGREKLLEALQSVVSNPDNTNTYLLQIITNKGKKNEPVNSITFQLNKPNQYYPMSAQPMQITGVNELIGKLNAIEQKLALLDSEDDDDDIEEEQSNGIGALFNNPQIQNMLMQGIMNMFTQKPQMSAVAGIPDNTDDKLKVALEILQKNVPDLADKLLKLADMSVQEPTKFKMLLNFL